MESAQATAHQEADGKDAGRAQHAQLRQSQGPESSQSFFAGNDIARPAENHHEHQEVHEAVTWALRGSCGGNRGGATQTTPSAPSTSQSASDWGCTPIP